MRKRITALGSLLLILAACTARKPATPDTPSSNGQNTGGVKFKSPTSHVVLETFYGSESFVPPAPPPKVAGPYHFKTTWIPGEIKFEGVVRTEPMGNAPKSKRVRVNITSVNFELQGRKGQQYKYWSDLEEAEARDLDSVLSYFATTAAAWAKKRPDHNQELSFHPKDSTFGVMLAIHDDGPEILFHSGDILYGAGLKIPIANISEVQAKLQAILNTLDSK